MAQSLRKSSLTARSPTGGSIRCCLSTGYITNIGTALADAYAIGKILYSERFEDIDPEHMADEIYTFLVGKPVYQDMKKDYGSIGRKAPFLNWW